MQFFLFLTELLGSKHTKTTLKAQGSIFSADLFNKILKKKFKYRIVQYSRFS